MVRAEFFILHGLANGRFRFLPGHRHRDALAQGQTVRLDHRRNRRGFQIFQRILRRVEYPVFRRGNTVFLHQILGKHLAAFDYRRILPGTEAGNSDRFQHIHAPQRQRIVRSHHRIIHSLFPGKGRDAVDILCADGNTHRVRRNAAVPGKCVYRFHGGVFLQLADDGMLPAASANYQQFHKFSFLRIVISPTSHLLISDHQPLTTNQ